MQRRKKMLVTGILLLLGTMACLVAAMFINGVVGVTDSGDPELASEWKTVLTPLTLSTGEIRKEHSGLEVVSFPNGEWVIGFAQNSHGLFVRGGGTFVVKDSRGHIRIFFGHICGPHFLRTFFRETADLDRFYLRLKHLKFTEHTLP
jgi:hypothetical protein